MSDGRPEVLGTPITIRKCVEIDVLGAPHLQKEKKQGILCKSFCQKSSGLVFEHADVSKCNNALNYVNAIENANEDVVEM